MNGRLQNELIMERKNDEKARAMPSYVGRWYLNLKASRKTGATCKSYLNKIYHFLSYIKDNPLDVSLNDINENTVTDYFLSIQTHKTENGIEYTSDSYQCTVWCCLDSFIGFLFDAGLIERNYIRGIKKPKNRDLTRINEHRVLLTSEDFRNILECVNENNKEFLKKRDYAILLTFMNTGMRETALTEITIDDLDMDNGKLYIIDKGGVRHTYNINDKFSSAIKDWLNVRGRTADNHLFISDKGKPMHVNTVAYLVKKYSEKALGHAVSPHKLRAGYCSILYDKTHDIEFVRRCVGHANTSTTQRYIVTKGSEKEKAAEIMADLL